MPFDPSQPYELVDSQAPQGSWASTFGREAAIAGVGLMAPSAGLLHRIPGVGNYVPSYEGTLALGPTPQGSAEHILSMAAQGGGYALPAAALLLGGGAPAAAGGLFASTAIGTGAGEAVRQYTEWPPLAQAAVGAAVGGGLGSLGGGAAAGGISPLGSVGRGVGASLIGGAVDLGLRGIAGVSPTMSYIGGQLADVLALGKMSSMQAPAMMPTVAGGMGGLLMGPPPQPDVPQR